MKKIVYFILFTLFFIFSTNIYASEIEYNTESNIKKAILVENYIKNHKSKIEKFILKYDIKNEPLLEKDIKELNELIQVLQKIQNTNIKKIKSDEIIKTVLIRIKELNKRLKLKLKSEKNKYEYNLKRKKELYSKLWIQLSYKINNINLKVAKNIFKDKINLSKKELKIKDYLIKLDKESKKLKKIWSINFKSEKEIRDSFVRILNNIKREVNSMKLTIKKD